MPVNLSFHPDPDVAWRRIEGTVLVVHLRTDRVFELDGPAARMWELVVAGCDFRQIIAMMQCEFDVSADELHSEVDKILTEMQNEGLVNA